ncbi:hypothetical protein CAMGR0001_1452 [Campylobacter gracilis RM3268]|uniref:Uncharacterized protein n=1 Tax=Campylobacter gracilis RM3268 TaxID=553220 RepID=C8PJQ1_9BACT|nr:hypothetical protein CAMGR0001_1452 [Campylobacter gracilis RM3268]
MRFIEKSLFWREWNEFLRVFLSRILIASDIAEYLYPF